MNSPSTMDPSGQTQAVTWTQVRLHDDGFWGPRLHTNRQTTLAIEYEQCLKTGRIDAFKLAWQPGQPNRPHEFWDSDVAKWVEATAYSLATHPDPSLQQKLDDVVNLIISAQQPDGYLNTYYTTVCPDNRWTNLKDMHEIYCAGHLVEAAVAHYQATGQRKLLDCLCRYVDLIDATFGPASEGKIPGYCGHEEIELALIKLYRVTREERYLKLCRFFIEQRGQSPHYYEQEARQQQRPFHRDNMIHYQAHLPVLDQKNADGHAVRAMYLYAGLIDLGVETGDQTLIDHARLLWRSVVEKRMYITGGVGSSPQGERFTFDYDLPNETAYAETCAAIGLVFFAHRMLLASPQASYADIIELALYNGILSGVNLTGDRFFYANPLRSSPALQFFKANPHTHHQRQAWFGTSCCPPNLARLLASLGGYLYATQQDTLYVHQYISSDAQLDLEDEPVRLHVTTHYPWEEQVGLKIDLDRPRTMTLALRIPGWCPNALATLNGQRVTQQPDASGYLRITRIWQPGDQVELTLPMPVQRQYTHPACRMNQGQVALRRGPVIYCVEEADLGFDPSQLRLPADAPLTSQHHPDLLQGVVTIEGHALRHDPSQWSGKLYDHTPPKQVAVPFRAIPYALWCNRQPGSMTVWIHE